MKMENPRQGLLREPCDDREGRMPECRGCTREVRVDVYGQKARRSLQSGSCNADPPGQLRLFRRQGGCLAELVSCGLRARACHVVMRDKASACTRYHRQATGLNLHRFSQSK